MTEFDDLPRRDKNHDTEEDAIVAFQKRLSESRAFILQAADRKDYGTDCQIEVNDNGRATNVRIHVQLKGTERTLNADGSISVEISRTNLNYLLMQDYSFYVCYHSPTGSLRICHADSVLWQYEYGGKAWLEQKSITVNFVDELTVDHLVHLAGVALSAARSSRDRRIEQSTTDPVGLPQRVISSAPDVHVPENSGRAGAILRQLFEQGADEVISAAFDKFLSVLGAKSDEMGLCYMAEINLGMVSPTKHPQRIQEAISYFRAKLDIGRYMVGGLHYTIGNAFSALGDEQSALVEYENALADPNFIEDPNQAARTHKNLGTSFERLGDTTRAVDHYREALRLNPELAEAHHALGIHCVHIGQFDDALVHLDHVVFEERDRIKAAAVIGWRANVLFNLGDARAAFREINGLLSQGDSVNWVWPWCARLVAGFGRSSPESAKLAVAFWQLYTKVHPNQSSARFELLLTTLYLRKTGESIGKSYAEFRDEFDRHMAHVDSKIAALPWDRLGHWAQDEENWVEAERCFRKAYELGGDLFGICLGTALNHLGRYEESLPVLLQQAETQKPDPVGWFQIASAYSRLKRESEAIEAYRKTLTLDPDYALALYNLGGSLWNTGEIRQASQVWKEAVARFPNHELADKVRRDFPWLL